MSRGKDIDEAIGRRQNPKAVRKVFLETGVSCEQAVIFATTGNWSPTAARSEAAYGDCTIAAA